MSYEESGANKAGSPMLVHTMHGHKVAVRVRQHGIVEDEKLA